MKTGLRKEIEYIKNKKKAEEMADEINEMMMKMSIQKQMEDASKKR
jgi:pyruvoyl-dependent arginine decarboxylase (PvlArgDC)